MEKLTIFEKNFENLKELAITIGVVEGKIIHATSAEESMVELVELVQAAGSDVVAKLLLKQDIDEDYYLDKKSLGEVCESAKKLGANFLVAIDELTEKQMKNIEEFSGLKIVDRTILLMEIIGNRSLRREGKLEVERAQLKYRLERIEAFQKIYKDGDGIGIYNPFGKKLLTDKKEIEDKIKYIETELSTIVKNRFVQRNKKGKSAPLVAFIGYTNSGKSALMNRILELDPDNEIEREVVVKDKILSTVDVSLRTTKLPSGREINMVDTVGFVSDLPNRILMAFRSTFEELRFADLILTIYDANSNQQDVQKRVMEYTFDRIGIKDKKSISVYNKADLLENIPEGDENNIYISTKTGYNFDKLIDLIEDNVF